MANTFYRNTWLDGANIPKSSVRDGFRDNIVYHVLSAADLRNLTTAGQQCISVGGVMYELDAADTTSVDNGTSVIVSEDGQRYKAASSLTASREQIPAARTYFVRPDGNDANTGLVNNAGGAFLTIQRAIDVAAGLDTNIFNVTIQIADGTYNFTQTILRTIVGAGSIVIQGNNATPANVICNSTLNVFTGAFTGTFTGRYQIRGMRITSISQGLLVNNSGAIDFLNIDFGACSTHLNANGGGQITAAGNYSISGGGLRHATAVGSGANVLVAARAVTLANTPNFSTAFAQASDLGRVRFAQNTYPGTGATGRRFDAFALGLVTTNGGGLTALPGSIDGTTATGGQFV